MKNKEKEIRDKVEIIDNNKIQIMEKKDKILFGVCSWLARKLNVDATIIRIAFVVALFMFGTGVGLYLILWIVKILEEK